MKYLKNFEGFSKKIPGEYKVGKTGFPNNWLKIKDTITHLIIEERDFEELPEFPNNLTTLEILYCNNIKKLPDFPDCLKSIVINNGDIQSPLSELPKLPPNLDYLAIIKTSIKELPSLPNKLTELHCEDNELVRLPKLPSKLEILNCYDNNLIELPELPNTLEWVSCNGNELIELPELPNKLEYLNCSDNKLTSLPQYPGYLYTACVGMNDYQVPIPFEYMEYDIQIKGYSHRKYYYDEQIQKFKSYEFQKELLTEYPEKNKDLIPLKYAKGIKKEFSYIFNAEDMGLL